MKQQYVLEIRERLSTFSQSFCDINNQPLISHLLPDALLKCHRPFTNNCELLVVIVGEVCVHLSTLSYLTGIFRAPACPSCAVVERNGSGSGLEANRGPCFPFYWYPNEGIVSRNGSWLFK